MLIHGYNTQFLQIVSTTANGILGRSPVGLGYSLIKVLAESTITQTQLLKTKKGIQVGYVYNLIVLAVLTGLPVLEQRNGLIAL